MRLRIIGMMAIILGVVAAAVFGRLTVTECQREDDTRATCTVAQVGLFAGGNARYERLSRAEVRCIYGQPGEPCTDTLTLYRDEEVIATRTDLPIDQQIVVADTVNNLIANPNANESSGYYPSLRQLGVRLLPTAGLLLGGAFAMIRGRQEKPRR